MPQQLDYWIFFLPPSWIILCNTPFLCGLEKRSLFLPDCIDCLPPVNFKCMSLFSEQHSA